MYNYCKRCDTDEKSADWNATLGNDPTVTVSTKDLAKNCGQVFFSFFHDPDLPEKQKKKISEFIRERFGPSSEWADVVKYWILILKKRKQHWSGESLIQPDYEQNITDRDTLPLQTLANWQYVFDITGESITKSSSQFNIFLNLSEKIFGAKIGSTSSHLALMDTWRDHMVWALRGKLNEQKYFGLALQPTNLSKN